jgi:hypothetical protein
MAHSCNPSFSGDRDRRNEVRSQLGQIVLPDPISKKPFTKKRAGPEVKALLKKLKPQKN